MRCACFSLLNSGDWLVSVESQTHGIHFDGMMTFGPDSTAQRKPSRLDTSIAFSRPSSESRNVSSSSISRVGQRSGFDRSHWSAPFDHEARLCVAMISIGIAGYCQNVDLQLLTPPLDGNSSGSHPTSHDIARAPRVAFPWPDRTTGRWTSLDDSARHGNAQHIRSGLAARSAHQRE